MDLVTPYIAMDRRQVMAGKVTAGQVLLPERTWGAALFADISDFTPLTESLVIEDGWRRG